MAKSNKKTVAASPVATMTATLRPYVCGASSAVFASAVIHPIDSAKVYVQLAQAGSRPSAVRLASEAVKQDGLRTLYRGISAATMRQAVYGTARIGLHTAFTNQLRAANNGQLTMAASVGSAFAAGSVAAVLGAPMDVALVRMQADAVQPHHLRRNYKGVADAVTRIAGSEGPAALFRGLTPTLARSVAMGVGALATFDQVKQEIVKRHGYSLATNVASAAIAGVACAVLAAPFDRIKTVSQNSKTAYKGTLDCARRIVAKDGIIGLWRGFLPFYARCAPHAALMLLAREQLYSAYDKAFA